MVEGKKVYRSQKDPHYAETNRAVSARANFIATSLKKWTEENHPEVLEAIQEEAYKRWPVPHPRYKLKRNDYSFVQALGKRK